MSFEHKRIVNALLVVMLLATSTAWPALSEQDKNLINAVKETNLEKVKEAINKGADVNAKDYIESKIGGIRDERNVVDTSAKTPLHWAVEKENLPIVELLVSNGADPNVKDEVTHTVREKEMMIQHLKLEVKSAKTPLHWAVEKENLQTVKYLVNNGADVNAKDKITRKAPRKTRKAGEGKFEVTDISRTPLHRAATKGNLPIVEFLVSKGANVNAKSENNKTPLHFAADQGNLPIVEFLVSKGADVYAQDNEGKTPFSYAKTQEIKDYLKAQGAM